MAENPPSKTTAQLVGRYRGPAHLVATRAPDLNLKAEGQQLAKRGERQRTCGAVRLAFSLGMTAPLMRGLDDAPIYSLAN